MFDTLARFEAMRTDRELAIARGERNHNLATELKALREQESQPAGAHRRQPARRWVHGTR